MGSVCALPHSSGRLTPSLIGLEVPAFRASGRRALAGPRPPSRSAASAARLACVRALTACPVHSALLVCSPRAPVACPLHWRSRLRSVLAFPASSLLGAQGWSALRPRSSRAPCHTAWHPCLAPAPSVRLHVHVLHPGGSSLTVTWHLGRCSRGTWPGTGAQEACPVDEFVFCLPDPGLWPRTVPLFSLPVSSSGGRPCGPGPDEGAGCPGSRPGELLSSGRWPQGFFPCGF